MYSGEIPIRLPMDHGLRHGGANFLTSFGEKLAVKSEPMDVSRQLKPGLFQDVRYSQWFLVMHIGSLLNIDLVRFI